MANVRVFGEKGEKSPSFSTINLAVFPPKQDGGYFRLVASEPKDFRDPKGERRYVTLSLGLTPELCLKAWEDGLNAATIMVFPHRKDEQPEPVGTPKTEKAKGGDAKKPF